MRASVEPEPAELDAPEGSVDTAAPAVVALVAAVEAPATVVVVEPADGVEVVVVAVDVGVPEPVDPVGVVNATVTLSPVSGRLSVTSVAV